LNKRECRSWCWTDVVLVGMGMMGGRFVLVKGLFDSTVLLKNRGGMRLQLLRGQKEVG